ncbi:MAG: hypothetical protein LKK13_05535 [Bacilli bacterium]|jgi:hypothetical protein|nr:hypothetical protein [Bacilli bacterium]
MKTRMGKWSSYRDRIAAMPSGKFPVSKRAGTPMGLSERSFVGSLSKSKNAIRPNSAVAALPRKKSTPYSVYAKRKRGWLIAKFALLALVAIGFIILWFYWVRKA